MDKDLDHSQEVARANRLALLAAIMIVVLPIATTLAIVYIAGFSERSMDNNMLYLFLVLFLPLDWAFGRLMHHRWWDQFSSWWLNRKNREWYGKSAILAVIFSLHAIDVAASFGANLMSVLLHIPLFLMAFALAHFAYEGLALLWKRRRR